MSKCKPGLDGDKIKRIHVRAKATPKTTPKLESSDKSKQAPAMAETQQTK